MLIVVADNAEQLLALLQQAPGTSSHFYRQAPPYILTHAKVHDAPVPVIEEIAERVLRFDSGKILRYVEQDGLNKQEKTETNNTPTASNE